LGQARYTLFTTDTGGILDDVTVARHGDHLAMVVNAARREVDLAHLRGEFGAAATMLEGRALLALQGPRAADVLATLAPGIGTLGFMRLTDAMIAGARCTITRSGYTGEDGFEISVAAEDAERVAEALLQNPQMMPAGLGARDTLRLEAGLCLYGHDIDETTSPVEAVLTWTIPKRRREKGGFPGAAIIRRQLAESPPRRRVGIRPEGRIIARDGTVILDTAGGEIGRVTSGGFSPVLDGPVAMGYVATRAARPGTAIGLRIRGAVHRAEIALLPFVPHRYYRGSQ
ncbi:MAG: glycine cleavage T C-terminal barrel domain-containing protein, partial [Stellaceae bacterium]